MRKLLLGIAILTGAVLTGLLLASLLLKQECPDCSASTRYFSENPNMGWGGPIIMNCPRCGDSGRVSLLNGRVGPAPDPLVAALMRASNRENWRRIEPREMLNARLRQSSLRTSSGVPWNSFAGSSGRSRFVRSEGKTCVLLVLEGGEWHLPEHVPVWFFLFDARGTLLDAVCMTARGGASTPQPKFIIPPGEDGTCAEITLLNWGSKPCEAVEIDHGGKLWKETPAEVREKLDQLKWKVLLRGGHLQIVDALGKSIAE